MKVLLICGDPEGQGNIRARVHRNFRVEPVVVTTAEEGFANLKEMSTEDVILLHTSFSDMGVLEIIEKIRGSFEDWISLIVISKGSVLQASETLDAGADDYIEEPFQVREFVSRFNALRRRAGWPPLSDQ